MNGAQVTVASHTHFDQHVSHPEFVCRLADDLAARGKTVIMVRHDAEVCSVFGVADMPRASSRQAIADLKARELLSYLPWRSKPSSSLWQ